MARNNYMPNFAVHPGKTLQDILDSLQMTQVELSNRTGMAKETICDIVQGRNPITPDTAIKLSEVFGMSMSFWNNMQRNYEETLARIRADEKLGKELPLLKKFICYSELAKYGYINKTRNEKEKITNLLNFFGVSSLEYVQKTYAVAFRRSKYANLSNESLAAWLRCGEIKARKINTEKFNKNKLEKCINEIKSLTREKPEIFQEKLINICAACGISVVFVPHFRKTFVNGATRWLSSDKAMIQLSLKGSYSDIFWFSFFHELAHILKHGKKEQFVEFENGYNNNLKDKENEADVFASGILIPQSDYVKFLKKEDLNDNYIIEFANKLGISKSIVAGRLAHDSGEWRKFEHLRSRLKFSD